MSWEVNCTDICKNQIIGVIFPLASSVFLVCLTNICSDLSSCRLTYKTESRGKSTSTCTMIYPHHPQKNAHFIFQIQPISPEDAPQTMIIVDNVGLNLCFIGPYLLVP